MRILIVNGPNLNFLGKREPEIYGNKSYDDLVNYLLDYAKNNNHYLEIYQSNHEGKIIDIIQEKYLNFDALIINPGAFTHYSYAIYDCLLSINIKIIEVHLSNIYKREDFRKVSVIKSACEEQFYGKGFESYVDAIKYLSKEV
jgi:3-dehydroquinate dehydratase-2